MPATTHYIAALAGDLRYEVCASTLQEVAAAFGYQLRLLSSEDDGEDEEEEEEEQPAVGLRNRL